MQPHKVCFVSNTGRLCWQASNSYISAIWQDCLVVCSQLLFDYPLVHLVFSRSFGWVYVSCARVVLSNGWPQILFLRATCSTSSKPHRANSATKGWASRTTEIKVSLAACACVFSDFTCLFYFSHKKSSQKKAHVSPCITEKESRLWRVNLRWLAPIILKFTNSIKVNHDSRREIG